MNLLGQFLHSNKRTKNGKKPTIYKGKTIPSQEREEGRNSGRDKGTVIPRPADGQLQVLGPSCNLTDFRDSGLIIDCDYYSNKCSMPSSSNHNNTCNNDKVINVVTMPHAES